MKRHWVVLFLAVMFSMVLWAMAAWFGYTWVQQVGTAGWPAADEAEVMESRVASRTRKGNRTHRPEVKYRYRVGVAWYEGERLSFSTGLSDSGGGYAQTVVSAHPAKKKITVYVDPADATRAVLFKGVHDRDWQTMAFIAPFAVVPVVIWGVYIGSVIRDGRGYVGTVQVVEPAPRPGVSVFRDIAFGPLAVGIGTLAGGTILTTVFILGFVGINTRDTLLVCWGGTVVLAVAAWFARRSWIKTGRKDGVIDTNEGKLWLPRGRKREAEVVDLTRVVGTTLRQDSSSSTNKRPHWRVHLRIEGDEKTRPVADIRLKADARDFENWVRERVGLTKEPGISRKRRKRKEAAVDEGED